MYIDSQLMLIHLNECRQDESSHYLRELGCGFNQLLIRGDKDWMLKNKRKKYEHEIVNDRWWERIDDVKHDDQTISRIMWFKWTQWIKI